MPDPDPPKEPFVASKAVTEAILDAINSQHQQAVFRSGPDGPHVNLTLKGTAGKAASAFIMGEAQRQLCNRGTLTTLTCNDKPGHAYYYFDVSTGGQDRRIEVGVTLDTDRAEYLIKKVSKIFK
jgi:hypothetical protein